MNLYTYCYNRANKIGAITNKIKKINKITLSRFCIYGFFIKKCKFN